MPLSAALPLLVERGLAPGESLARDRFLLDAVLADPARWPAALRVYDVAGAAVSLGRWQLAPAASADGGVALLRRLSGGRTAAFGAGFVGVTLVLPRRGALLDPAAPPLSPEQVPNRYVRGILGGLADAGVPALYPGRDTLTARRRLLGVLGFTETRGGAVLVETILATSGDPSALARLLDRADPGGTIRAPMLAPAEATSLAAELGRAPTVEAIAAAMAGGHARHLGVAPVARTLAPAERDHVAALAAGALAPARWLADRGPRRDLDREVTVPTMLGALTVQLARTADGRIADVRLAGDLLAPDDTIPALEAALRGCAAERRAVETAVAGVLADPRHFVLGVGPAATLADAVARACG